MSNNKVPSDLSYENLLY